MWKSILKKSNGFDWSKIKISYGSAIKIPILLEALKSPFHLERENAYSSLENSVVRQGDLFEGAYHIIEPLIAILEDEFSLDKNKALDLLFEISNGYALEDEFININGSRYSLTKACWWKVKSYENIINNLQVNESDKEIKADLLENLANINIASNFTETEKMQDEALDDWNVYGKDFPEKTHVLIEQLLKKLQLDNEELSEDLLYKIDKTITDSKILEDFHKKHFLHIVALIGEILINKNSAKWIMKQGIDGLRWKPYLELDKNKICLNEFNFITYIHGEVFVKNTQKKNFLSDIYERENWMISLKR